MRNLLVVTLLVLTLKSSTEAALLRLDVTYTNGHIVTGPLSADLTELPTSVLAAFILTGSATSQDAFGLEDVLQASLAFGDGAWTVSDLQSFATTLFHREGGGIAVTSLSYAMAPVDTPTVSHRITTNFPLHVRGTDLASGEAFDYQYDTSTQTVTVTPEPSTFTLAALNVLGLVAWRWRRRPDGAE